MNTRDLTYKQILQVTVPVMLGLLIQFGVAVTDSAFLSRVNGIAYSAAGNGGMMYITFIMIAYGIAGGSQILIARREGEGSFPRVGIVFRKTLLFLAGISVMGILLFYVSSHWLIHSLVSSDLLAHDMTEYLEVRSWGLIFVPFSMALNAYYMGLGRTRVITAAMLMQGISNVILDYMWVAGGWGCEPMGVYGAALATALSDGLAMLVYVIYGMADGKNKAYSLWKGGLKDPESGGLFRLSLPLIGQGIISTGSWTVFFLLISQLGNRDIEISHNIRNLYFLCLISVMGFSTATRTFISQMQARGEQDVVIKNLKKIIHLSLVFTGAVVLLFFLFPAEIISVVNRNDEIMYDSVYTLRLVCGSMFIFGLCGPMISMVAGAGDTQKSFMIELSTIVVYLLVAWVITVLYPQPIYIVWCLEYIYFAMLFVLSYRYIARGKWKTIKI